MRLKIGMAYLYLTVLEALQAILKVSDVGKKNLGSNCWLQVNPFKIS